MNTDTGFSVLIICHFFLTTLAIDCFKCISINKDFPPCEDPFHNNYTLDVFQSPCMAGRKGRDGLYPATSCVKINGVFDDTGENMVVRGCALDSGTLTTDTELVRMSHCGRFYYDERYVRGCVQTCSDADACNSSQKLHIGQFVVFINLLLILLLRLYNFY